MVALCYEMVLILFYQLFSSYELRYFLLILLNRAKRFIVRFIVYLAGFLRKCILIAKIIVFYDMYVSHVSFH